MFKKVHLKLTLLCTGITVFIMIIMSLSFLFVSEKNLYKNQFLSFQADMNNLVSNLEQQQIITNKWIGQMEFSRSYILSLTDNGIPLLHNRLRSLSDNQRDTLIKEALDAYNSLSVSSSGNHFEYSFLSPSTGKEYYSCLVELIKNQGSLNAVIISPLDSLREQIFDQRMLFLMINLFSTVSLALFSWFFTWKLLKPIEKNQKSQTEFVSAASHELRTPLSVILSCTESYQNADSPKQDGLVRTIQAESVRMSRLIEDMLTLSQSDNYRFSVEKEETELDTLLLNSTESFESMAKEKQITLSVSLPEKSLPFCLCDRDRIGQVLAILLHNAICYTPAEGHILVSLQRKKDHFSISVADSGMGIPDEEKEKIFDRFYRAEKSRSTKGHFGLGLCIAYEIVKAHQGTIKLSDAIDGGAVFTVLLP